MELIKPNRTSRCTWKLDAKESPHTTRMEPTDLNKALPDILHAIGGTPMVKLNNIPKDYGIKCEIFAKCEYFNPGGSVKDRIAYRMVQDAEEKGILKPGYTIIEPTSGNTGIGLAMVAAIRGYRCIIVMPEKMSNEKVFTLRALGAEIVRTPTEASWDSPEAHIAVSQKLQKEIPNSVILDQYTNPGNPLAHYDRTATEIWEQCNGNIDYFVGGAGTGGTISGIGRKLKELSPKTRIIAVDPRGSILARPENLNKGGVGFYEVEGIGYDFIPTVLDHDVVDDWIKTEDCDALSASRMLIRKEGLLCGGSSGSALVAALQIAKDLPEGKRVVVLLPDGVRNYMTKFLSDHWMEARGFKAPPEPIRENKWWWNLPVSCLSLKKPKFLKETATCQDALNILEETNAQQLLVSNDDTHAQGVIVANTLMSKLISGAVKPTDYVSKAMLKSFPKVTSKTSLGLVSRVLEQDSFAVVVLEDPKDNGVLGVISQSHVLSFITGNNGMIVANNH